MTKQGNMEIHKTYESIIENKKAIWENYHHWYFKIEVHNATTWRGIPCLKSVSDMWNYQEIIVSMRPTLIIEFGVFNGGATLYFADLLKNIGSGKILAVDSALGNCASLVRKHELVETMECSSTHTSVAHKIKTMNTERIFCILDSDHSKNHVLAEMESLRHILKKGDYLIVEDSQLGGNPVGEQYGTDSPFAAREEYFNRYPNDYKYDTEREMKFGFTYSTKGFLIRQ